MTKRVFAVAAVGLAVLVAGGLVASNMGFKANYHLDTIGSNGSVSGAQTLGMPYNQQTGINIAEDLINDIDTDAGVPIVDSVSRILRTTDFKQTYSLSSGGTNFAITPGEGYIVVVTASADYIMVGSHNPVLPINLDSPGTNGSNSGTQLWSMPYHFTGTDAESLINAIESHGSPGDVDSVTSLIRTSAAPLTYSLTSGGTNFALTPGEAYVIVVLNDVNGWIPAHF
jgi:hypothetical protein